MKISVLVAQLLAVLEKEGNLEVFVGDMQTPGLDVSETVHEDDVPVYGKTYLMIEERRG